MDENILHEVDSFRSAADYHEFLRLIENAKDERQLDETPVLAPYSGSTLFDEHWYVALDGTRWRLVAPDPPFPGLFARVD